MTETQALTLKDLFYRIKQFYYGAGDHPFSSAHRSAGDAAEYIAALKEAEAMLTLPDTGRVLAADAERMLLYTAALTREALTEGNIRLAGDVSALGVKLVGVYVFPCIGRRRFWKKCVLPFREEHGAGYFAEQEADFLSRPSAALLLRPSFSRKEGYYYDDDADEALKLSHPVVYALFVALGMFLFLGSIVGFGLVSRFGFSAGSPWLILGYLGAAAFGAGLYSLSMTFIRQYIGHLLTLLFSVGGALAMVLSLVLHFALAV